MGRGVRCGLAWRTYGEAIKARCLERARVSTPELSAAGRPPTAAGGGGVGSRPGSCQLALKELQDFPKVTGIVSQIRIRPLRGNPRFFSFPYIDESSC